MDILLFLISFVVILAGCEFFTNAVEWLGKRYNLAEGAIGSVLAAVGTALPETLVPLIAILFVGGQAGEEIGPGPSSARHSCSQRWPCSSAASACSSSPRGEAGRRWPSTAC